MNYVTEIIVDGIRKQSFVYTPVTEQGSVQIRYGGDGDIDLDNCIGASSEAIAGCLAVTCHTPQEVAMYDHIRVECTIGKPKALDPLGVDATVLGVAVEKRHSKIAIMTPGTTIQTFGTHGSVVTRRSDYAVTICSLIELLRTLNVWEYETVYLYNESYMTTIHIDGLLRTRFGRVLAACGS